MKLIEEEYYEDSGDTRYIYEVTYEELLEYLDNPPSWELTINTSKGEWDCLSDYTQEDVLVKDKIYHISELIPLDDRTYVYIEEVR